MNLPNRLSILRILLIPLFVFFMLSDFSKWIALIIFVVASLTDMLDGKIARKYNLVTDFGKFMDPLADKLLVCSALICLVELKRIPAWIVIAIISREFIISGFRLVAAEKQIVIAANFWGKIKTVCQMFMVILMIANIRELMLITQIMMWLSLILTVVSLMTYMVQNKSVLHGE